MVEPPAFLDEKSVWDELVPKLSERIKRVGRRLFYPSRGLLTTALARRRRLFGGMNADRVLWGERGNDYASRRRILKRFVRLAEARVLIVGCGTGTDLISWLPHGPALIRAVDQASYGGVWSRLAAACRRRYPEVDIDLHQADITKLDRVFDRASFDIVGSDAVFEHLTDLPAALAQMKHVLRPGGWLYAAYGPLYRCWGGDHVSGRGEILAEGYNHLLLDPDQYQAYLTQVEAERRGTYETEWVRNGLLSRLTMVDYLSAFNRDWDLKFLQFMVCPTAVRFQRLFPDRWSRLVAMGHQDEDLFCKTMTVVLQLKPLEETSRPVSAGKR